MDFDSNEIPQSNQGSSGKYRMITNRHDWSSKREEEDDEKDGKNDEENEDE